MSKNHMAEVAKILGVELGEPFKITSGIQDDYQSYYRFTENNCFETSYDGIEWKTTIVAVLLKHILMGDIRIVKLPWKPTNEGEWYYTPALDTESGCYTVYWENDDTDKRRYRRGLVFKTREEAIAVSKKMLDILEEVRGNE